MKKLVTCLVIAGLAVLGGQSFAVLGTIDNVPAATLLLPYFEVDLNDGSTDTFFSINNASPDPVVAHVVVWTDWSQPVLDFPVYLTGYDVVTISMYNIIGNGNLPVTGIGVSNNGAFSAAGGQPSSCDAFFPYTNPALSSTFRTEHLQPALTGGASSLFGGQCFGSAAYGDNTARGYVTVDLVTECELTTPTSAEYFPGGATGGIIGFDNVLWGDWSLIDQDNESAQGETLVHIEALETVADASIPAADLMAAGFLDINSAGAFYTFYGRYIDWEGYDRREALASTWATPYLENAAFDGGTTLYVWRDGKTGAGDTGSCAGGPSWYPMGQEQIVTFDQNENPELAAGCTVSPCPGLDEVSPFPLETQAAIVDGEGVPGFAWPVSFEAGWIFLNLNSDEGEAVDPYRQAWVTTVLKAQGTLGLPGRFSTGFDAIMLDNVSFRPTNDCLALAGAIDSPCP